MRLKYLPFLFAVFCLMTVNAQSDSSDEPDSIYFFTDVDSTPRCKCNIDSFLKKNLQWPAQELGSCGEFVVVVEFIVERDGRIGNVKVATKGPHTNFENEAVHAVKKLPRWVPGWKNGKIVRARVTIPVRFVIDG